MAKKKSHGAGVQKHKITGHEVLILSRGEEERVTVDGRPLRFHKTDAGYLLADNVYVKPQKTLLAAVELLLKGPAGRAE